VQNIIQCDAMLITVVDQQLSTKNGITRIKGIIISDVKYLTRLFFRPQLKQLQIK